MTNLFTWGIEIVLQKNMSLGGFQPSLSVSTLNYSGGLAVAAKSLFALFYFPVCLPFVSQPTGDFFIYLSQALNCLSFFLSSHSQPGLQVSYCLCWESLVAHFFWGKKKTPNMFSFGFPMIDHFLVSAGFPFCNRFQFTDHNFHHSFCSDNHIWPQRGGQYNFWELEFLF